ncbi:MAG: accessory factor UbiK family protein [Caulobacterales bacterium]|nr:accessory factor UbiK family protein [Caulobacterales bacterium]MCA0373307.1 accessory factor UbiK family protein [Pseudomonadota bacterium]
MQTRHPFFDDIAKLANSAAGVAQGVSEEARTFFNSQMERFIADMDLVRRDEYDILLERVEKLEALVSELSAPKAKKSNKTD